ncbi:MAG: DUF5668 domain-containing protein [Pseudomonadota bacterium]
MKNEMSNKGMPGQVILGIVVIAMGTLFLLDNMGIFDFHNAFHFWPMVMIVIGTAKLCDSRSGNGYLLGAGLVAAGVLMTLSRMGYLYFSWHTMWPLLLILLGGSVVYRALTGRRFLTPNARTDDSSDAVIDVTAILGGFERRVMSQQFRGGEVTAIMGGCVLDMRNASFEGEAVINVFAALGGITVKVPTDWTVVLHGTPIMGGFDEKTSAPPDSAKRLVIKGYAIMGGVEVRN